MFWTVHDFVSGFDWVILLYAGSRKIVNAKGYDE